MIDTGTSCATMMLDTKCGLPRHGMASTLVSYDCSTTGSARMLLGSACTPGFAVGCRIEFVGARVSPVPGAPMSQWLIGDGAGFARMAVPPIPRTRLNCGSQVPARLSQKMLLNRSGLL